MPMASVASPPRLAWTAKWVNRVVLATCAQVSRPPRRTPVSSTCSTGARTSASLRRVSTYRRRERCCALPHPALQCAQREGSAEEVGAQFAYPAVGHELLLQQIDGEGPQAWSILRTARRLGRERAHTHRLAVETP